ncbi:class I SAM-dependent methyltransferase [Bacillus sp. AFS055030]|uniref:class I SAM-dependent methyltransferase n=1 Tax=Bacillus sp. AFS055030 TaxID=2033507 RepID=UPI000BFB7543|nr:class I SAM-dependent methyltransferase [Bacillus sp. AFS055030]PGL73085.1 SAM-dependent methyltransferase [Bacillus sp. AFS055030]
MIKNAVESVIDCMASGKGMSDLQRIQTEHRFKLVEFWNIEMGSKVLEIGCGQGDTTAVLAYSVGENGLVHGIDIGPRTYGSPISLGDSADFLLQSNLGNQLKMEFEIDILSSTVDFREHEFDYIVMSHCSWYLKSKEELIAVLKKIKKWGKKLCFAEWDTRISSIEQYPHLLSILIQAQYESLKQNSESNIRTLFTPNDIKNICEDSGWNIMNETTINSPNLQDGSWEVKKTLEDIDIELNNIENLPSKLNELIRSEVKMLEESITSIVIKPLSVFVFVAK